jgi:hypothetical protein
VASAVVLIIWNISGVLEFCDDLDGVDKADLQENKKCKINALSHSSKWVRIERGTAPLSSKKEGPPLPFCLRPY